MRNIKEATSCTREIAHYLVTNPTSWDKMEGDLSFALTVLGAQAEHLLNTSSALKKEARRLRRDLKRRK